jgi:hypothetical protein
MAFSGFDFFFSPFSPSSSLYTRLSLYLKSANDVESVDSKSTRMIFSVHISQSEILQTERDTTREKFSLPKLKELQVECVIIVSLP